MIFKILPMATGVLEANFRHAHVLQKCRVAPPKEIRGLERFSALCEASKISVPYLIDTARFLIPGIDGILEICEKNLSKAVTNTNKVIDAA